jgi:hypothetical protein
MRARWTAPVAVGCRATHALRRHSLYFHQRLSTQNGVLSGTWAAPPAHRARRHGVARPAAGGAGRRALQDGHRPQCASRRGPPGTPWESAKHHILRWSVNLHGQQLCSGPGNIFSWGIARARTGRRALVLHDQVLGRRPQVAGGAERDGSDAGPGGPGPGPYCHSTLPFE